MGRKDPELHVTQRYDNRNLPENVNCWELYFTMNKAFQLTRKFSGEGIAWLVKTVQQWKYLLNFNPPEEAQWIISKVVGFQGPTRSSTFEFWSFINLNRILVPSLPQRQEMEYTMLIMEVQ